MSVAPWVIFGLVLVSIAGVEPRQASQLTNTDPATNSTEQEISLGAAWQVLRSSPQVGYFFAVLSLFTFSLFLQEAVLEPYGGAVFGMDVCTTTRLNAIWGVGTLLGIASTGFLLTPRLGAQRTALVGGLLSACFVVLIVVAGSISSESLFRASLFLFGAAAGISTNASLTLMLGLTSPLMAGTFIGVWGLAQAYARGLATISGGALLSGFGTLTGSQNSFAAYAGVFIIQAIGLLVAGLLLLRVDTKLFQRRVEKALSSILSSELD